MKNRIKTRWHFSSGKNILEMIIWNKPNIPFYFVSFLVTTVSLWNSSSLFGLALS